MLRSEFGGGPSEKKAPKSTGGILQAFGLLDDEKPSGTVPLPAIPEPDIKAPTTKTIYGMNGPQVTQMQGTSAEDAEAMQSDYTAALFARAMGTDKQGPHLPGQGVGVGEKHRMTPENYAALEPEAKAAVDFNTMLARAVKKDLNHQEEYAPSDDQQAVYDENLKRMFGEVEAGSDTYAPETLGVLRQIDYANDDAKLDDFLNLNAAITRDDIKEMQGGPFGGILNVALSDNSARYQEVQQLATGTSRLEEALAQGNRLLQSVPASAALERNEDVGFMGGLANSPKTMLGYGPPVLDAAGNPGDLNTYFQKAFTELSTPKGGVSLDELKTKMSALPDEGAFESFLAYADARSGNAQRFGVALGGDESVQYRSPEQFRQLLGLDE